MNSLTGKLVRLRPVRESDFEFFAALKNDLRTQAYNQRLPMRATVDGVRDWWEKERKKPFSGEWSIETLKGKLVGHIGYEEYAPRHAATMGVIIGVEYWGKGYNQEAHELILNFLFEERGIQIVKLYTQGGGKRGIAAAKKIGFQVSSIGREGCIIGGKAVDHVIMDMLREDWYKSRKKKDRLPPL